MINKERKKMSIKQYLQKIYDEDYFKNGLITRKSCYLNYRWMPELTIKMAFNMIKHLDLKESQKVLDFGCAKGYLVKALRILDIEAYGCDVSEYAIKKVDPEVREYCKLSNPDLEGSIIPFKLKRNFDWIITKDVLEHISEDQLIIFLKTALKHCDKMFHTIPLGENGKFRIADYNNDPSHKTIKDEAWWIETFKSTGWSLKKFDYEVRGIKENWAQRYKNVKGNGFFILNK